MDLGKVKCFLIVIVFALVGLILKLVSMVSVEIALIVAVVFGLFAGYIWKK